jgi:tetratricopeptide (TPR) repeat protein
MGDLLTSSGRASRAIRYYQEALGQKEIKEEEVGRLYHNMGVAEAKLFRFENAKINFIKAYQYTGEESSLFYYYCIMALADGIEAGANVLMDDKVTYLSGENLINYLRSIPASSIENIELNSARYLKNIEK